MKTDDWKIEFAVDDVDCDEICEHGVVVEDGLPSVPRIGEVVWVTEEIEDKLDEVVKTCWRKHKCENCPFMPHPSTIDYIYVKNVIYKMNDKFVKVVLSNDREDCV